MTRYLVPFCGVALVAGSLVAGVSAQSAAAEVHVNAARAAVNPPSSNPNAPFLSFDALFDQVCREPSLPDTMRMNDRSAVLPFEEWYTYPVDIFDNLTFIGTKTAGVWAISSSEGIIVIDASFHYASQELALGLLNFGLDPNDIKYIVVTHAHDDRYWGARALQDTYPRRACGHVCRRLGCRGTGQLTGGVQAPEGHGSSPMVRRSRSAT